ncbi:MAG: flagellar protein FlgN [Cellulosilyticaceae bacterium]
MAGIIYDLVDILEQQKECYEGLLTLATYKTDAVTKKELELLTQIVHREEEFIGRVNLLDKKRESVIKDIALVTGLQYKDVTVTKIVTKLGEKVDATKDLIKLREAILATIEQLKKQNAINEMIIKQSLEFVDFTVNALRSTRIAGPSANYSRPGSYTGEQNKSFFDTKQ